MREIKFRGKRTSNGEWVYGYLVRDGNGMNAIYGYDLYPEVVSPVVPDTVGQFTGLHDKNGKEIYEGDIVVIAGGFKGVVRYNARYWRYEVAMVDEPLENERIPSGRPEECWMVIGNIHDNQNYLKLNNHGNNKD